MTNNSNQPKHTQGELKIGVPFFQEQRKIWVCNVGTGRGKLAECVGLTEQEAEAKAQRIVKAVNLLAQIENYIAENRNKPVEPMLCEKLRKLLGEEISSKKQTGNFLFED